MTPQERRNSIDAQWKALQPGWGAKNYDGKRKMLYGT